jgi:tetratricopeptide (TPR) repeat protein
MVATTETLTCKGCGSSLSYSAGMQTLTCQYCESVMQIAQPERAPDNAKKVIPLTVEQTALEQAVLRHLASGEYTPDDLVERAVLSTIERFYVPAFQFDGQYTAHWTASFGFSRGETYVDTERRTENGQTRTVAVTKDRTVTDWNAVSGNDTGNFNLLGYAGSDLAPKAVKLLEQCGGAPTGYNASYVSGFDTQPFTVKENDAYTTRVEPQVNAMIDVGVRRHAQGVQQKDWHWTANIRKKAVPVYVPVCHVEVDYRGQKYNVWTDGTNTANLSADVLPVDKGRKYSVRFGWVLPGLATAVVFIPPLSEEGSLTDITLRAVACTIVVWGLAFWRRHRIVHGSLKRRAAKYERQAARIAARDNDASTVPQLPNLAPTTSLSDVDWIAMAMTLVSTVLVVTLFWWNANTAPKPPAVETGPIVQSVVPQISDVQPVSGYVNVAQEPSLPAMRSAANASDWATVQAIADKLKQTMPKRGNRGKSRAANERGLKALLQNDNMAAIEAFQGAISADPANMEARNNLGGVYVRMGDYNAAITVLGNMLQAAPESSKGWRSMAEASALNGNAIDADASLRLMLHYATERKSAIDALKKRADSIAPDKFSEAASRVLMTWQD